jgi:hypothetical protein
MKLRLAFFTVLGVSGVVIACSGSSTTTTTGGGTASDSQSFIEQFCVLLAPCCGQINKPTDGAFCKAIYGGLLGKAQYDSAKGNACLSELQAASSSTTFCTNPTSGTMSCNGAFMNAGGGGAVQPGDLCTNDTDCATPPQGSVRCASNYTGNAVTKACQVSLPGKLGDTPCLGTRDGSTTYYSGSLPTGDAGTKPAAQGYLCDVADNTYCNNKGVCTAIADVGGACDGSSTYACVKTAYCDYASKKCVARAAVGDSCATNSQACAAMAYCDPATKKCTAGLADGTACTTSMQCASGQCVNQKCGSTGNDSFSLALICGN